MTMKSMWEATRSVVSANISRKYFQIPRRFTRMNTRNPLGLLRAVGISLTILAPLPLSAQSLPPGAQIARPANAQVLPDETAAATANAPSFRVTPVFDLHERYSDNVAPELSSTARSDWVTDAAAGLLVDFRSARTSAHVDYRVNRLFHRQVSNLDATQHLLNSNARLEAVEKWLFLDASANISQENRSAFGVTDVVGIASTSANRVETTSYQVAPSIRGNISDVATYQLRVNAAETRTGESAFPDAKTYQWTGFVKNAQSAGRLGWSINGGVLAVDNSTVGRRQDSRIAATATFEVDAQFHVSISAGTESSDLDGNARRVTNTHGFGFEWSPSQRTQMAAVTQTRFFGNDHLVTIAHRTPLTVWRLSSAKEIGTSIDGAASSNPFSVSNLLSDLLASTIPDPIMRAEAVKQKLEQSGIPTSSGIQAGTLTARPFLSFRQEASAALLGLRNTVTIGLGRREQRAIDSNIATPGSGAPVEEFRQVLSNIAWAYRLTPISNLNLTYSYARTEGLFADRRTTKQRYQSLSYVTQLGPHTSMSLGVQRVNFDSSVANSYRENAFASSLSVRF